MDMIVAWIALAIGLLSLSVTIALKVRVSIKFDVNQCMDKRREMKKAMISCPHVGWYEETNWDGEDYRFDIGSHFGEFPRRFPMFGSVYICRICGLKCSDEYAQKIVNNWQDLLANAGSWQELMILRKKIEGSDA